MILDRKGRLFGKFSIIDLIVLIFILFIISGVGYKYSKSRTITAFSNSDNIRVTFYSDEVADFAINAVNNGDKVRDLARNTEFGSVEKVESGKSKSIAVNDQGAYVVSSKDGYKSVKLFVSGKGIYGDNGISFDNTDYYIGKNVELRVGNSTFWVRVYSFEKLN